MSNFSRLFAYWLIALRWPLLLVAVVLAALSWRPAQQVAFDRSVENLFAPGDPLLPPYEKLKRTFGGNEIVMAVYADDDLFHPDGSGIQRLAEMSEKMRALPGVMDVLSIDRPLDESIVDPDNLIAQRTRALFEKYTHGSDGKTAAIVCMLQPRGATQASREQTIDEIRAIVARPPGGLAPGVVTGEPAMVAEGFALIDRDGRRLSFWSTVLLGATIIVCFRSLWWVLIPIAIVQLTLLLTRATFVVSGLQLSMVSSMLTAIVTVVSVATVVHVIVHFRQARSEGQEPLDALRTTAANLAAPIFFACSTDAVGFASLMAASVQPVADFGVMMAIGAIYAMISVALLTPALAMLCRAPAAVLKPVSLGGVFDADPHRAWGERSLESGLAKLVGAVEHRPVFVSAATVVVTALAVVGMLLLEVETDFTKNFRPGSRIVQSYEAVEANLGGAGVLDVMLPAPESLNLQYLRLAQDLEERLRREVVVLDEQGNETPGLTKALSFADAVQAAAGDLEEPAAGPLRQVRSNVKAQAPIRGMRLKIPAFAAALHSEDPQQTGQYWFRIMLRARERQPAEQKLQIIEQVTRIARDELQKPSWSETLTALGAANAEAPENEVRVTGFFVLLVNLIDSILQDQWKTFAIAAVGIGLMMLLAFRRPLVALVALVPNALPIVLVLGGMGWLGAIGLPVKMNMGAAMIAAVSMGLSVDSSIHYITSFQRALKAGKSVAAALAEAQHGVGRALVFATLALVAGFAVLCASEFMPTVYFGALVSLSMLGGLFGNLLVLPLLLKLVTRERAIPKETR